MSDYVWDVTLEEGYKFSDGTDVDAQHVADCLSELNTENPSAQSSLGAMTVTAPDAKTVRIQSERQTHVMDAVLAEWVFVVYYVDADGNFVYTGPFAVEAFHAGSRAGRSVATPRHRLAFHRRAATSTSSRTSSTRTRPTARRSSSRNSTAKTSPRPSAAATSTSPSTCPSTRWPICGPNASASSRSRSGTTT